MRYHAAQFFTVGALALSLPSAYAVPASQAANSAVTTVVTAAGALEGTVEAGVRSYKGVPYAEPPVGNLRWKPPQPVQKWQGVRKATAFGPRAMQLPLYADMVFRSPAPSEDCLYLNVWTPAKSPSDKLPVLVYFHGGGFAAGDGSEPRYDGAAMAAHGIVTVTVNYRLNVFGFLAHPELSAESPHKASGNYGLMDQAAALQWVKRNIGAFGGDPARVTIAGESAGSYSVSAHLVSPLSQGLLAGAIGESGSLLGLRTPETLSSAELAGVAFAHNVKAPTLGALRALSARQLLDATRGAEKRFFVVEDGYVIPRSPAAMYAAGVQSKVPLLAGWNSQEGHYRQVLGDAEPTVANLQAALQKLYGERAAAARQAYLQPYLGKLEEREAVRQATTDLASDRFISWGAARWVSTHARTSGQPVYRYYYTRPRPGDKGAPHAAEIEYALGNLDANKTYAWTHQDRALSSLMQNYFANFIKTGNPNGNGLPEWPRASSGKGSSLLRLDAESRAVTASDDARFEFQESVNAGRRQDGAQK